MKQCSDEEGHCVVYIHIPKTGGMTFYQILMRQFRDKTVQINNNKDIKIQFKNNPLAKCFMGHMSFKVSNYVKNPCQYISIVRHPVDRIVSLYSHIKLGDHPYSSIIKGMSLQEFVMGRITNETVNDMIRYICGRWNISDSYADDAPIDRNDFDMAKENIEKNFKMVGISERYDEFLVILKMMFGWGNMCYKKLNVTENKFSASEKDISVIQKVNNLDLELYEFIKYRFEKLLEKQNDQFWKDVKSFKNMNSFYQKMCKNHG